MKLETCRVGEPILRRLGVPRVRESTLVLPEGRGGRTGGMLSASTSSPSRLARYFKLEERGTTVARELRGGFVSFLSVAYILVLNPIILSGTDSTGAYLGGGTSGPNIPAVAAGTALVAGVMTIFMGAYANFPLVMAAGLGLNSVVAYTIVKLPGMTWADGMGIIVLEGIVITLLVLTGLREAIFRAVPKYLRTAISVGIGLFVTLVGLVNSGLVRTGGGTPLSFGINGSLGSWPLLVFVIAFIVTVMCFARNIPGGILIGIATGTVLAVIVQAVAHLSPISDDNPAGWASNAPAIQGSPVQLPHFSTLGQFSIVGPFQRLGVVAVVVLTFSVMLADFFDTMGTMVGVAREGNIFDKNGNPENTGRILLVDSLSALAGGMGGVSSNTAFVESSTGVADGARTGLASVFTGIFFLLSMFLAPIVGLVPNEAAAPALVTVGFLMMRSVVDIDWQDIAAAVPAFLTIAFMPFAYSITVGIGVGFIMHVILAAITGKAKRVHPLFWITAAFFVVYFMLDPIQHALVG